MKNGPTSSGGKSLTELGTRLARCGVIIGEENFKVLLVDKYDTQYPGVPVDLFLCNPSKAISFALGVCKEIGRTPEQLPIPLVLETLLRTHREDAR